jgi:hypothetical protein
VSEAAPSTPIVTWDAWFADPALRPAGDVDDLHRRLGQVRALLETFAALLNDEQVEMSALTRLCREHEAALHDAEQSLVVVTTSLDALVGYFGTAAVARLLGRAPGEVETHRSDAVTLAGYDDRRYGLSCRFAVESMEVPALVAAPGLALVYGRFPAPRSLVDLAHAVPAPLEVTASRANTRQMGTAEADVNVATVRALAVVIDAIRRGDVASAGPIVAALDARYDKLPTTALTEHAAATFAEALRSDLALHQLDLPGDVARALLPPRLYEALTEAEWKASRPEPRW